MSVDAELPPHKIGTITSKSKVICWDEGWSTKFLKKSEELSELVMLQLVKSVLRLTSILPCLIQNFVCSLSPYYSLETRKYLVYPENGI